jgi:alpha-N-arabinofuranosidase
MAVAYIEYCNFPRGTKWSDLRRSHGYEQPHNVKYWCLGNEMDGPWQIGALTSREYGRKARDIAQQARVIDPNVQLIACGSSGPGMSTYLAWDREVLEECYDMVDGISLHCYYGNAESSGGKSERYLAMNLDMDRQIQEITAVCDYVQGLKRSPKKLWLSFDEWNVWYRANRDEHTNGRGKFAPKLLEEIYNLEDALLVGGLLNTLMRRSDRVHVGCLAQIVNVIAPLMTNENGVLRQSTYYPYAMALKYAHGRILDLEVDCETYPISAAGIRGSYARDGQVPFVDVVATYDASAKRVAVFALNRDLANERELALSFEDITPSSVLACETVTGGDLKAFNTFESPNKVVAAKLDAGTAGAKMSIKLPARSYTVVHLAV